MLRDRYEHLSAILWVLLSTAIFTVIFAAAKFGDGVIGTFQIMFLRFLGAFVVVLAIAIHLGGLGRFRSPRLGRHFLRAVCGCGAAAAITWATANMPIADATAIGMLYGVITVGLGMLFLGEKVGRGHWVAVVLSLIGAAVVMVDRGAFQSAVSLLPVGIALLSAILMSIEGLFIGVLSRLESAVSMMLYMTGFGTIFMLGPALAEWRPISFDVLALCLILGPAGVAAQYCTIRGYRTAPLSVVGPVDYSWLIFAMLLGLFAFHEVPRWGALIGGGLILAGGVLLARLKPALPSTPVAANRPRR